MKFTTEFKQKVYDALQFNPYLLSCMEALEKDSPNAFRIAIELAMDDINDGMVPRLLLDEGDRLLWNGIVTQYWAITELYTEFMEIFIKELDYKKVKTHG